MRIRRQPVGHRRRWELIAENATGVTCATGAGGSRSGATTRCREKARRGDAAAGDARWPDAIENDVAIATGGVGVSRDRAAGDRIAASDDDVVEVTRDAMPVESRHGIGAPVLVRVVKVNRLLEMPEELVQEPRRIRIELRLLHEKSRHTAPIVDRVPHREMTIGIDAPVPLAVGDQRQDPRVGRNYHLIPADTPSRSRSICRPCTRTRPAWSMAIVNGTASHARCAGTGPDAVAANGSSIAGSIHRMSTNPAPSTE